MLRAAIRILGIDPGLRNLGWGLIECEGSRLSFVACGSIHTKSGDDFAVRLRALHDGLTIIVAAHAPHEAAIEETFVNRDPQSALKLGHARAIGMLVPALADIAVHEYAANLIKKTVVGAGHADKNQVGAMVRILLPRSDARTADAADALAVAICHAQHRGAKARLAQAAAS